MAIHSKKQWLTSMGVKYTPLMPRKSHNKRDTLLVLVPVLVPVLLPVLVSILVCVLLPVLVPVLVSS